MDRLVKMEIPEVTEFDVYLDIDGTVEEDEGNQNDSDKQYDVPILNEGEEFVQFPWPSGEIVQRSGLGNIVVGTSHLKGQETVTSNTFHSLHNDSDNEVDVDTPFEAKLMGQTQIKCETSTPGRGLLARMLSFQTTSDPVPSLSTQQFTAGKKLGVARKSTTQKIKKTSSAAVARKSTTPKRGQKQSPGMPTYSQSASSSSISRTNVAKKSTTKVAKSGFQPKKGKIANVLQVKFGPKTSPFSNASNMLPSSKNSPTVSSYSEATRKALNKKIAKRMPAGHIQQTKNSVGSKLLSPQTKMKMFYCQERCSSKIACPECSAMVGQWCLRAHLRTVHNLPMRNCKKCKSTFTDLNLFSEHYALHLQEEEDENSGINTFSKVNMIKMPQETSSPGEQPRKTLSMKKQQAETKASTSSISFSNKNSAHARHSVMQFASNPKKRQSTTVLGKQAKSQRFVDDFWTVPASVRVPDQPKLPRKLPKATSYSPKRKLSSPFSQKSGMFDDGLIDEDRRNLVDCSDFDDSTSSFSSELSDLVLPKMPLKPRKPPFHHKMTKGSSLRGKKFSQERDNRRLTESFQSRASSSSDIGDFQSQPYNVNYRKNQKAAYRRRETFGPASTSMTNVPVLHQKRPRQDDASVNTESKDHSMKVTVSLVSLETASRPFDCETCFAAFEEALVCPQSFRHHSQLKPYTCSLCPAAFAHLDMLKEHQRKQCQAAVLKYDQEDRSSVSSDTVLRRHRSPSIPSQEDMDLLQHVPEKSYNKGGGVFECHVCKERFQYRSILIRHLPYHSLQYCCGICKKAFKQKVDLLDHLQIMHDGRMLLRCRYCEQRYDDMSQFDDHLRTHKNGTVVACTVCHKKFGNSRLMQKHLSIVHGDTQGSLYCKICEKSFKLARSLSVHMKLAHRKAKPAMTNFLSCRFCSKVFHGEKGLSSHYRLWHGLSLSAAQSNIRATKGAIMEPPKPLQTDVQSRPTISVPKLQNEQRTARAVNESAHECNICGRQYKYFYKLRLHYRNFHGTKPLENSKLLECKICGKKGLRLHGLKVHYRICHKQSMPPLVPKVGKFQCIKCCKSFKQRSSLYRHNGIFHRKNVNITSNMEPIQSNTKSLKTAFYAEPIMRKKPWLCPVCKKVFSLRKSMRMHMKAEHPESFEDERIGTRKCKCGKRFHSKGLLRAHLSVCFRSSGQRQQNTFAKVGKPSSKNQKIPNNGHYPCLMCKRTFNWKQNFIRHMHIDHNLPKEEILYNMNQTESVSPNIVMHTTPYLCKVCKACFTEKRAFSRHFKRVHGGEIGFFQCRRRFCKKKFAYTSSLFQHMRTMHPGMPNYRCEGCHAGFNSSGQLHGHGCFSGDNPEAFASYGNRSSEDGNDFVPLVQECRYRCTTCDIGFHVAREWTKHMQEHQEMLSEDTADYEQVMDATDKIRLNIFDVMSANSVFACQLCKKIFTDENALMDHDCEMSESSRNTNTFTGKVKRKGGVSSKHHKPEQVRCTVCMKIFSSFSIRKHMRNIHSLPMRVCKKCNIVFTDLVRYKRHMQDHSRRKMSEGEMASVPVATCDDEAKDDSVTYFICQPCGGFFTDADSLSLHDCMAKEADLEDHSHQESDTFLMPVIINESGVTDAQYDSNDFTEINQGDEDLNLHTGNSTIATNSGMLQAEEESESPMCGEEITQDTVNCKNVDMSLAVTADLSKGTLAADQNVGETTATYISDATMLPQIAMTKRLHANQSRISRGEMVYDTRTVLPAIHIELEAGEGFTTCKEENTEEIAVKGINPEQPVTKQTVIDVEAADELNFQINDMLHDQSRSVMKSFNEVQTMEPWYASQQQAEQETQIPGLEENGQTLSENTDESHTHPSVGMKEFIEEQIMEPQYASQQQTEKEPQMHGLVESNGDENADEALKNLKVQSCEQDQEAIQEATCSLKGFDPARPEKDQGENHYTYDSVRKDFGNEIINPSSTGNSKSEEHNRKVTSAETSDTDLLEEVGPIQDAYNRSLGDFGMNEANTKLDNVEAIPTQKTDDDLSLEKSGQKTENIAYCEDLI